MKRLLIGIIIAAAIIGACDYPMQGDIPKWQYRSENPTNDDPATVHIEIDWGDE